MRVQSSSCPSYCVCPRLLVKAVHALAAVGCFGACTQVCPMQLTGYRSTRPSVKDLLPCVCSIRVYWFAKKKHEPKCHEAKRFVAEMELYKNRNMMHPWCTAYSHGGSMLIHASG
eukprot:1160995-Pelagomonas_calceolata.AAC.5